MLLHNICLMDNASKEVVSRGGDVHFDPSCPNRGVVKRWRLHLNRHKENKHTHNRYVRHKSEKQKCEAGKRIREVYVLDLALQGRTRDVVRGANRCAASQQKNAI